MIAVSMLSFFAFIVYLYVGIITFKLNKKSVINRLFLLLCISMAIWSFAYSFAYIAKDAMTFSIWNKIAAPGWCSFNAIILYMVLVITESRISNHNFIRIVVFLPAPVFLYMSIFLFGPNIKTPGIIENIFYIGNSVYNFSYQLLSISIISIWGIRSHNKRQRIQAKIIAVASSVPFILNFITQTVLPLLSISSASLMGQIYSLIMIFGVYIAITKYRFFDIPVSNITDEVLAEMVDLFILLDPKGRIIKVNNQALKLTGYCCQELIGRDISFILDDGQIENIFNNSDWERTDFKYTETHCITKGKDIIPLDISCKLMIDPRIKDLLGVLIIGQDISITKELAVEIGKHKETAEKLRCANKEIERINQELELKNSILLDANDVLHSKSIRDSLTNLYNHVYTYQALEKEIETARIYNKHLCVMMLDIDHFKRVNDQYGHQTGDKVLAAISEIIRSNVRNTDIVGRYGGEEFMIILPGANIGEAAAIAERIRKNIEEYRMEEKDFKVTISVGLTQYSGQDTEMIISRADQLLYKVKESGRNRVEASV